VVLDEEVENGVDLAAALLPPKPPPDAPNPMEGSFGAILPLSGGADENPVVVPPTPPNALVVDDDDPNAD
jgi:hypothetical protein